MPQPVLITDPLKYSLDDSFCKTVAKNYNPSFDSGSVVVGTVRGAAQNAPASVMNPVMTAIGAASGAVSSGAESLDVFGQAQANVYRNCLHDKTMQDGSAVLANPN